jgi:hypothetical protein
MKEHFLLLFRVHSAILHSLHCVICFFNHITLQTVLIRRRLSTQSFCIHLCIYVNDVGAAGLVVARQHYTLRYQGSEK